MEINLNQVLKNLDDEEVKVNDEILTLRRTCVNALLTQTEDDKRLTGEDKFKLAELARAIHGSETIDLKSEDIVLLKKRIGKIYLPLMILQAYEMLEKKNEDEDSRKEN